MSPSIQLTVESLINVHCKSLPYEVKWGLIIEYQCSCLFCNVPKSENKEVQRKRKRWLWVKLKIIQSVVISLRPNVPVHLNVFIG